VGDQVQLAIGEAEPIQNHRHHRRSHTHISTTFSDLRVQPCCYPCFSTHCCHNPSRIQPLCLRLTLL
jgi:hypothetical protein